MSEETTRALVFLPAALTPLLEKNAAKTMAARQMKAPVVFSMARVIVLAFAVAMLHQEWQVGVVGWPEATLSMAVVLALPLLNAMERLRPKDVVEVVKSAVERFGIGSARRDQVRLVAQEPSKFDDHRDDRAVQVAERSLDPAA